MPNSDSVPSQLQSLCAAEKIHIPGTIQPHGVLIAVTEHTLSIVQASESVFTIFGIAHQNLIGQPIKTLIGSEQQAQLEQQLSANTSIMDPLRLTVSCNSSQNEFEAIIHRSDGLLIIEFEAAPSLQPDQSLDFFRTSNQAIAHLMACTNQEQLLQLVAEFVRTLSGFDRIMVYMFDREWNGTVLAECKAAEANSYLGLKFPASDIPSQARELYKRNRLRLLVNAWAEPSPICPSTNPLTSEPLDLSDSILRAMSPVHIEYLKNMGVTASMSLSLISNSDLRGLIVCHHSSPKYVDYSVRQACDFLARLVSLQIDAIEERETFKRLELLKDARKDLLLHIARQDDLPSAIASSGKLLEVAGAKGAAVVWDEQCFLIGNTPDALQITQLVTDLIDTNLPVFVSDSVSKHLPSAECMTVSASGLLAIRIATSNSKWLLWFRPEQLEEVSWAGKEEEVGYRDARGHLHPRKSFEIWKERALGKSIPWLSCEIQSALELRTDVLDITLSITEKRRAADLERQVDALNTLLQVLLVASDAATQASQRKSEMVSVVSHDLRAPLTSIQGALSLLKNGFCEIDKAEGAELVEIAYTGCNYLLNLVNDLLNLETIESGGITLEKSEVPVSKLIDDAFRLVRSAADLQGIKLESEVEVEVSTVWADKDQLLKVLVNLISNAIKFSPEHSRILVSAQSSNRDTTFKVTDQGRGIPSQFRQTIFQRFKQVETADRNEKGGAGLGLAICKAAVEAHGGAIGVESEVSKGSTFWFSLPPSRGLLDTDGTIDGAVAIDHDITDRRKQVLQESEERYRLILAGMKDYAIFMLDRNGFIQTWSEGAERIKGYGAAEIIGKHFSVFYTHHDRRLGLPESELKIAIARGRFEGQGWRLRKDGSSFFAEVVITPLFVHEGTLSGFTKITRDITDRMLAEQEIADARSRLSLALQSAAVGVWDLDLVKNSTWHSLRHDEIFGHQELLPKWNFGIFITYVIPEDRALAKEAFQLGLGHGEFSLQCRIIRASDKAVRWISMRGETFRNEKGDPVRMMGTVLDITDIKEQEEQQRLLAIMNEREDFMATLTHDMKNPIIGANRLLEMFVAGRLGALSSEQCELLQHLRESNASLLKLIENLIDVYRLEQDVNVLVWTECDLVPIFASCLSRISTFANLRSINVISQLPEKLVVRADARRLERVVQNLLDNALKFTPDGGTINVRLLSLVDNTIIEIEDNGPGIALEDHSRLFKRFSQGGAGKRHTGGSGLGLYLCKQIIEAHGGTIECKCQPNIATIFRLNMPKDYNKTQQASALDGN